MNVENILKVADAIEQHSIPDLGFNMAEWHSKAYEDAPDRSGHDCGTVACIGGWTEAVLNNGKEFPSWEDVGACLGLGAIDSEQLFFGNGCNTRTTLAQAVRTLRHLAATGKVNWHLPDPA